MITYDKAAQRLRLSCQFCGKRTSEHVHAIDYENAPVLSERVTNMGYYYQASGFECAACPVCAFEADYIDNDVALELLQTSKDIEECISCGAFNAYNSDFENMMRDEKNPFRFRRVMAEDGLSDGGEVYTSEDFPTLNWQQDIFHIPAASGDEWSCGKCGAHHVDINSPLLAEVYTHNPLPNFDN